MPNQETTIKILKSFKAGTLPRNVEGIEGLSYSTVRRYYRLFKLARSGDSLAAMCHATTWSESTVKLMVQWLVEAEPDMFKYSRGEPDVDADAGQPAVVTPEIDVKKQPDHPKEISKLADLFENRLVIPQATRISGVGVGEWSRGFYGSLDGKPRLTIESDPLFKEVVATYEVDGFEQALVWFKSSLLEYSTAAQKLAAAITEQIQSNENIWIGDSESIEVPAGLVLAVMHSCLERVSGVARKTPAINVIGDTATGFVLKLGGWRAEFGEKSTAGSVAANFGTMIISASGLAELNQVKESRSGCGEALIEVISTLRPKRRRKI